MTLTTKQQQYEAFVNDCKERIANRVINCDNYYISTKVRFNAICSAYDMCNDSSLGIVGVDKVWVEMKKQGLEHTVSPKGSGSEYLVDRKTVSFTENQTIGVDAHLVIGESILIFKAFMQLQKRLFQNLKTP